MQYSVPSIAEIDMTSTGSGFGQLLTNSLTAIKKKQEKNKRKANNNKNFEFSVHHDIILPFVLRGTSMRKLEWF